MIIRKLTAQDLPTRVARMNDSRVYSSMHFDVPVRIDKTEEWFTRVSKDEHRFDAVFTDEMGGVKYSRSEALRQYAPTTIRQRLISLPILMDSTRGHWNGSHATAL